MMVFITLYSFLSWILITIGIIWMWMAHLDSLLQIFPTNLMNEYMKLWSLVSYPDRSLYQQIRTIDTVTSTGHGTSEFLGRNTSSIITAVALNTAHSLLLHYDVLLTVNPHTVDRCIVDRYSFRQWHFVQPETNGSLRALRTNPSIFYWMSHFD